MAKKSTKMLNLSQIEKLLKSGLQIYDVLKPAFDKYGPDFVSAAGSGARKAANVAKQAQASLENKKSDIVTRTKNRTSAKDVARKVKAARILAIDSNTSTLEAKEFMGIYESFNEMTDGMGYLQIPGCFAIITMPNAYTKESVKFSDVYVGCGDSMGTEIYKHLIGKGNIDVYADTKANKHMRILTYPCAHEQMFDLKESLILNLQAYNSYNKSEYQTSQGGRFSE